MKPLTFQSSPEKILKRIQELQSKLETTGGLSRTPIKAELTNLYRLRKKQKNYTPPPKKINLKGL